MDDDHTYERIDLELLLPADEHGERLFDAEKLKGVLRTTAQFEVEYWAAASCWIRDVALPSSTADRLEIVFDGIEIFGCFPESYGNPGYFSGQSVFQTKTAFV